MHFSGGVLGDPSQDHGHTKPSDYCRVRYSGPTLFSQMSNKMIIVLITTSHTCLLVKSFDSALEYLIIICRKIKLPFSGVCLWDSTSPRRPGRSRMYHRRRLCHVRGRHHHGKSTLEVPLGNRPPFVLYV